MSGPNGELCSKCYYWEGVNKDGQGECVVSHITIPKKGCKWCGKYKSRQRIKPPPTTKPGKGVTAYPTKPRPIGKD
jgi:hypothetical protein